MSHRAPSPRPEKRRPRRSVAVRRPPRAAADAGPSFEQLESRLLLSTLTWTGAVNGNWNQVGNWSDVLAVPASGDTLIFPAGAGNITNVNNTTAGNSYLIQFTGGGYTISGNSITLSLAGADIASGSGSNTMSTPLVLSGTSEVSTTGGGTLTLTGSLSGAGALLKSGSATLIVSGNSSYSGLTTVSEGTLAVTATNALGSAASGTNVAAGATLDFRNVNYSTAEALTINGAVLSTSTGSSTFAGNIALAAGDATVSVTGSSLNLSGIVSGVGLGFTKTGGGTLTLSGSGSNTYSGVTTVHGGMVDLNKTGVRALVGNLVIGDGVSPATVRLLQANQIHDGRDVTLAAGGVLDLNGRNEEFDGLTGGGTVTNSSATAATLVVGAGNDAAADFAGTIQNGTGAIGLTKLGAGTQILSGANSYTGNTLVQNTGTLLVNGSTAAGSAVTVAVNARLGGTGTIGGPVTVQSGGTLSPGVSAAILRTGNVSFAAGATFRIEVNGDAAGADHDQLKVTGTVALGSATLWTSGVIASLPAGDIMLIDNDGVEAVTGTFSGLPQGSSLTIGNVTFTISYTGGDGNDVTLTPTGVLYAASGDLELRLDPTGTDIELYEEGVLIASENLAAAAGRTISIQGADDSSDSLTVNFVHGSPIPAGAGVVFTGGAGAAADTLLVTGPSATAITHTLVSATSGAVLIDGSLISYSGIESVGDELVTQARTFAFTGGAQTIALEDAPVAGMMVLTSSLAAPATFANPSTSLTVSAGSGSDSINVVSLDTAFGAALAVHGDAGADSVTIQSALAVASLLIDAEEIQVNGGAVSTTGSQMYSGPVTLGAATVLTAGGDSSIQAVDKGGFDLTIFTGGDWSALGVISGAGAVTKSGSGVLILSAANTYGGPTSVEAGTLRLAAVSALPVTTAVTLTDIAGALLDLNGFDATVASLAGGGALGGDVVLGNGTLTIGDGTDTVYAGMIGGAGGLVKIGSGALTLTGHNAYTGATLISGGTLAFGVNDALPAATAVTISGGALGVGAFSGTVGGVVLIDGDIFGTSGVLTSASGFGTRSGNISAILDGAQGLTKTTTGTVTLTAANSYTGPTLINGGTLVLGHATSTLADATAVTIDDGVLDIGLNSDTVAAVSLLSGQITGTGGTLTSTAAFDVRDGSIAANLNGLAGLVKSSAGNVTLSGDNNYSGATSVTGGTLLVDGSLGAGTPVSVADGATLSGTGTIFGAVTVHDGGAIDPGLSPGILKTGPLTFSAGSVFAVEFTGTGQVAGADYDQLDVVGHVVTEDATLDPIDLSFTPLPGDVYILIRNDGSDVVTGTFADLAEGAILSADFFGSGLTARITYAGGDGNDVAVVVDGPMPAFLVEDGQPNDWTIRRSGDNLQVLRDGSVLDSRPIGGVTQVLILGEDSQSDTLTIDVTGFGGDFVGSLVFVAGSGTTDSIVLASDDALRAITYEAVNATDGRIHIRAEGALPFTVHYFDVPSLVQDAEALDVELLFSDMAQTVTVGNADDGRVHIDSTAAASVTLPPPAVSLALHAGGGDDDFVIDGLGAGFAASLTVDGAGGDDSTALSAPLILGSVVAEGHLTLVAETITLSGGVIRTDGGASGGNVMLSATEMHVDADLLLRTRATASDGTLMIAGQLVSPAAITFDLGASGLTLDHPDNEMATVAIATASSAVLADSSSIQLGPSDIAGNLTVMAGGSITAAGPLQVIGHATFLAGTVISLEGDAIDFGGLTFAAPGSVSITEASDTLLIGTSSGQNVTLSSGDAITAADGGADVTITAVNLVLVAAAGIGTAAHSPIRTAADALDVTNTLSGGIFIASDGALRLADLGGPDGRAVNGIGGGGFIRATGPLVIEAEAVISGGISYSVLDSSAAGEDLTIAAGVRVENTGGPLVLSAGDDVILAAASSVQALGPGGTLNIYMDAGDADGGVGGAARIHGTVGAEAGPVLVSGGPDQDAMSLDASADVVAANVSITNDGDGDGTITGLASGTIQFTSIASVELIVGAAADSVTVEPNAGTVYQLLGGLPDLPPGDVLTIDLQTLIGATLALTAPGAGHWTFTGGQQPITYGGFEQAGAVGGAFDLVLDMASMGLEDGAADEILLLLDPGGMRTDLHINHLPAFSGPSPSIRSVRINGSADDETLTIDDVHGLPTFAGAAPIGPDNLQIPGLAGLLFHGGGGSDALVFHLDLAGVSDDETHLTYAVGDGAGGGFTEGEILVENTAAGAALQIYFTGLEPITTLGTPGGALTLIADSDPNLVQVQPGMPGLTRLDVQTGLDPFESLSFAAGAFTSLNIQGRGGADILDLIGFDPGETSLLHVQLDGGAGDDELSIRSTGGLSAASVIALLGGAGSDSFILDSTPEDGAATGTVQAIGARIAVSPAGDDPAGIDVLTIVDTDGPAAMVTITNAVMEGLASIQYGAAGAIESIHIFSSDAGGDTFNIRGTRLGSVYTLHTGGGDDATHIGSQAPDLALSTLDGIAGPIYLNTGPGIDRLSISDDGDLTGDTYAFTRVAGATELSFGDGPAAVDIRYNADGTAQLEHFVLIGSRAGNNTYTLHHTTATLSSTIIDGDGNAAFFIQGDQLQGGAAHAFRGLAGADRFTLAFAADAAVPATAGTTLVIDGGSPIGSADQRDRVDIDATADALARVLGVSYINSAKSSGDVDIAGFGSAGAIEMRNIEQLNYNGGGAGDALILTGTTGNDVLSVTPLTTGSVNVFMDGVPFTDGGSQSPQDNRPGVGGGGAGPDLTFAGVGQSSFTLAGGGGADRLVINAPTESNGGVADLSATAGWAGNDLGGGSTIRPAGQAFSDITVSDSAVQIQWVGDGSGAVDLLRIGYAAGDFDRPGTENDIVINAGQQSGVRTSGPLAGLVADDVTVALSMMTRFQINAGAPLLPTAGPLRGDRLTVAALPGGSIDLYADATPQSPNVGISSTAAGLSSAPVDYHGIELVTLRPDDATRQLNILGDHAGTNPGQRDDILIVGADVDSAMGGDADGAGELFALINGSSPIAVHNVAFLNISTGGGDDRVTLRPYADNTSSGWGIDVRIDGGEGGDHIVYGHADRDTLGQPGIRFIDDSPAGGVAGVSEDVTLELSGPAGTGQIRSVSPGGGPIATITVAGVESTSFFLNDGVAGDADTLTLRGTALNDYIAVDFAGAGDAAEPWADLVPLRVQKFARATPVIASPAALSPLPLVTILLGAGDDVLHFTAGDNVLAPAVVHAQSRTIHMTGTRDGDDAFSITPGATSDSGMITAQPAGGVGRAIHFTATSDIHINGGGFTAGTSSRDTLTVDGSAGGDAFVVSAHQPQGAGPGGSIAGYRGPTITFADLGIDGAAQRATSALHLIGRGGDDTFTLTHTPGWLIDAVQVDGGPQAAGDSLFLRGTQQDDSFVYLATSEDAGVVDVTSGGSTTRYALTGIESASIDALGEDAADSLAAASTNAVIAPGFEPGSGAIESFSTAAAAFLPLMYRHVESLSLSGTTALIEGTAANDLFHLSSDGILTVTNALGFHNAVDVSAFDALILRGLGGDDLLIVHAAPNRAEHISVAVMAGGTEQQITGLGAPIHVAAINRIRVLGAGDDDELALQLGPGNHHVRIERGADVDRVLSASLPIIEFAALAGFAVETGAGSSIVTFATRSLAGAAADGYRMIGGAADTLVIEGADGAADAFIVTQPAEGSVAVYDGEGAQVTVTGYGPLGRLAIHARGGDDGIVIDIDGGGPIDVPLLIEGGAGDDALQVMGTPLLPLNEVLYAPAAGRLEYLTGPDVQMRIELSGIESIEDLSATASLTVVGTDAANSITYTAGAAGHGRIAVGAMPFIEFAQKTELNINARGGGDTVTVVAGAAGPAVFAPVAADAGVLQLVDASLTLSLRGIEHLLYEGPGGDSSLTLAAAGSITYRPGASDDAGSLGAAGLLPVHFQNLGAGGSLHLDHTAAATTLVIESPSRSAQVTLTSTSARVNDHLPIHHHLSEDQAVRLRAESVTLLGDPLANIITLDLAAATVAGIGPLLVLDGAVSLMIIDGAGADSDTFFVRGLDASSHLQSIALIGNGDDELHIAGGPGDDIITVMPTAAGSGAFQGSPAGPAVSYSGFGGLVAVDGGPDGFDILRIFGTDMADIVTSMAGCVRVNAGEVSLGEGIDGLHLFTFGGDDVVHLGGLMIPSRIDGGTGDDSLTGGAASDQLDGGAGNDTLTGGPGDDTLIGGTGSDAFLVHPGDGRVLIEGGAGESDALVLSTGAEPGSYSIFGDDTRLAVSGSATTRASDVEHLVISSVSGADHLALGDLSPTTIRQVDIDFSGQTATGAVHIELTAGDDHVTLAPDGNSLRLTGLRHALSIARTTPAHILRINSLAGDDTITAAAVGDNSMGLLLDGGDGDDALTGSAGHDTLIGGPGVDTIVATAGPGSESITYILTDTHLVGRGDDVLTGIERARLTGTSGPDVFDVSGFSGDTTLIGLAGDDRFIGGPGNDEMRGGAGDDTYILGAGGLPLGDDHIVSAGGGDTLDFSQAGSGVVIDLDTQAVQAIAPGAMLRITGPIVHFIGSAFPDHVRAGLLHQPRSVLGGPPTDAAGDVLTVQPNGEAVTVDGDPAAPGVQPLITGGPGQVAPIAAAGYAPLLFNGFEDVVVPQALGPQDFAAPVPAMAGMRAAALTAADLNGDGFADILAAYRRSPKITVLLNDTSGSFIEGGDFFAGPKPAALAVGDIDGDGDIDLLVAHGGRRRAISILSNGGDGVFASASVITLGGQRITKLDLADFDGDGALDLLAARGRRGGLTIIPGDGAGGFALAEMMHLATGGQATIIGDFNNDGATDVLTVEQGSGVIRLHTAMAEHAPPGPPQLVGGAIRSMIAADLNGDGRLDLAFVQGRRADLSLALGFGDGRFATPVTVHVGSRRVAGPIVLVADDLDGDGAVDLVKMGLKGHGLQVLLRNPSI